MSPSVNITSSTSLEDFSTQYKTHNQFTRTLSVPEITSRPNWEADHARTNCKSCYQPFTLFMRRKHHCRACGCLVCADCSNNFQKIPSLGYHLPVRVCPSCRQDSIIMSPVSETQDLSPSYLIPEPNLYLIPSAIILMAKEVILEKAAESNYVDFVGSAALNWLLDAELITNRTMGISLMKSLVRHGFIQCVHVNDSDANTCDVNVCSNSSSSGHEISFAFFRIRSSSLTESTSSSVCSLSSISSVEENSRSLTNSPISTAEQASFITPRKVCSRSGSVEMYSATKRCQNCKRSFHANRTCAPGFCSIDCRTNASFRSRDARIARQLCVS